MLLQGLAWFISSTGYSKGMKGMHEQVLRWFLLNWAMCRNTNDHTIDHLAMPYIEHVDTTCTHTYLDVSLSS